MLKKRNPFIAAFMSILTPGLGQIYVGQPKNGVLLLLGLYLVFISLGLANLLSTFYGFVFLISALFLLQIFAIITAVVPERKEIELVIPPKNK